MNKNDLLELIKMLKIDKEEFWVLSSGALVLRGIYSNVRDLDIAVTNEGLAQLKSNYNMIQKENGWFVVSDNVDCICDGEKGSLKYQPQKIGDYYVQNIEEYLEYLNNSNREKDKLRIPIVEEYMKKSIQSER